ncbi:hypothetical protein KCU61_g8648, partial [Aureobasidium melanogenum]
MDFLRHHWYDLGLIPGFSMLYYMRVNYRTLTRAQKYLILNFFALTCHQFEEYRFPGGFPAIMNGIVQKSPVPDRWPLNSNSSMLINTFTTYCIYFPVIFMPDQTILGLVSVIFGFQQFVIHAININKAAGTIYTPGLTTVLLGFIPNGVKYIQHCHAAGRLGIREFLIGFVSAVSFGYLILNKVTFTWLPDMNSPYPFSASELSRFGARLAGVA